MENTSSTSLKVLRSSLWLARDDDDDISHRLIRRFTQKLHRMYPIT